jgi:predicted RND superfamily exporter protein
MKFKVGVIVIVIVIIILLVFNVSLQSKLEISVSQTEAIQQELDLANKEKKETEADLVRVQNERDISEKELLDTKEQLVSTQESMQLIDDSLSGDGTTLEKIEKLLSENSQLKAERDTMSDSVKDLEDKLAEPNEVQDTGGFEEQDQWVDDLTKIIGFVDNRIDELENATSNLPVLSLERVMIGQEVDFLDETRNSMKQLQDDIKAVE